MVVNILGTEYVVTSNTSAIEGMGADGYELGYEDGWNKCLEKIAGENER